MNNPEFKEDDLRFLPEPRQWLLSGGSGFEDGEEGLRAATISGEGLVEILDAYRRDCVDSLLQAANE